MPDMDENTRCAILSKMENAIHQQGFTYIAGVDEAGRGPLAGPVVAAAVILPENCILEGVNDSKKLSPRQREMVLKRILENAVDVSIGEVLPEEIDRINILQASWQAMRKALSGLKTHPDYVLVDGWAIPGVPNQKGVVKGDAKCISIAAASIVAKVTRDKIMEELDKHWPVYGFAKHKGYPTKQHLEALNLYGPCPIHRKSFKPVSQVILPFMEIENG